MLFQLAIETQSYDFKNTTELLANNDISQKYKYSPSPAVAQLVEVLSGVL